MRITSHFIPALCVTTAFVLFSYSTFAKPRAREIGIPFEGIPGSLNAITDVAGASDYFRGSLVSYATEAKIALGVPAEVIAEHGVISQQTAEAMARAARERLDADIGVGVTGVAGDEAVEGLPPGTMHVAIADGERVEHQHTQYYQGREAAKRRAVQQALSLLRGFLMARGERG